MPISKTLYEPNYGVFQNIEDYTPNHRAFIEDTIISFSNPTVITKVVALL